MKALTWELVRPFLVALLIFTFGISMSLVMQSREQAQTVEIIAGRQTGVITDVEEILANQRVIMEKQTRILELLEAQEDQERSN